MLKLIALAVTALFVVGSLYDFPSACYDRRVFDKCVRAQVTGLTTFTRKSNSVLGNDVVNWDDPRIIGH